jgi:hypothetical protein
MRTYYILSLKYSGPRQGLMFFRPDDRGYTTNLAEAAIYDEKAISSRLDYYDNGEETRAVPVEAVRELERRVVRFDDLGALESKAATSARMLPIGKGLARPGAVA